MIVVFDQTQNPEQNGHEYLLRYGAVAIWARGQLAIEALPMAASRVQLLWS